MARPAKTEEQPPPVVEKDAKDEEYIDPNDAPLQAAGTQAVKVAGEVPNLPKYMKTPIAAAAHLDYVLNAFDQDDGEAILAIVAAGQKRRFKLAPLPTSNR